MLHRLRELVAPVTHRVVLTGAADAGRQAAARALHHLLTEAPDLLLAAVADVATGATLATYTSQSQWRAAEVVGPCAIGLRRLQAVQTASSEPDHLQEVLLTLGSQVHALRLTPDGQRVLYLAVDSHDLNLALAREVMGTAIVLLAPVS